MPETPATPSARSHHPVRRALRQALAKRPTSLYMLLAIPVVMLLAVPLFEYREDPRRFTFLVATQFVFLGIILARAIFDLLEIAVRHYRDEQEAFKKTLGDHAFCQELGRRVKKGERDE